MLSEGQVVYNCLLEILKCNRPITEKGREGHRKEDVSWIRET